MGRKKKIEEPDLEPEVFMDEIPEEELTSNDVEEEQELDLDDVSDVSDVDDTITGRIHKGQLSRTRSDIQTIIKSKIKQKIEDKKQEFIKRAREAQ